MQQRIRKLNLGNVETIKSVFYKDIESLGKTIQSKKGHQLLLAMKRDKLGHGPYPEVSMFEAANRIMSDLVILHGIEGLLKNKIFPFDEYTVEFGNENRNGFDVEAHSATETLAGEAFNVAPSFFKEKRKKTLKKLYENATGKTYRLIIYNAEALTTNFFTNEKNFIHQVIVEISSGKIVVIPPSRLLTPVD